MQRVLIYRLGSLGDTAVAVPALRVVERVFPQAERRMLTNIPVHAKAPAAAAILDGSGLVHGYMSYPMATRDPWKLAKVVWQIRRYRPEVLVYLTGLRGDAVVERDRRFFRLCGVRRMVGLPLGELGRNRFDPATGVYEQEGRRLLRCVRELGEADGDDLRLWDLGLTAEEERRASEALAGLNGAAFVGCGPGTKMPAKEWGEERWQELLARVHAAMPGRGLVLVGAKEDEAVSRVAAARWRGPVVNVCGELTPRETAAVLRRAELFLGADSGPMHLAAAYGVPCAIPFAALDLPGRWFPNGAQHRPVYHRVECANCRLTVCIEKKKQCLTSISVEEMFAAAMEAWKGRETV